ncbi:hypothetical protein BDW59DRAFT_140007 [Aspergillus cavernicola]|uniref:NTF2 domain-containing protein n=1 Tax=Aspergillus cavernicola TaxID=176166 RepID=A0ABR4IY32_9EURO
MSLKDVYQRFLADPRSAPLASDVSLIYITSTTELNDAEAVIKHLTRQQHIVNVKSQTVIDTVQGSNSLCLDVVTAVQFVSGGGAYLPNLDETFLLDRVATFPTIHIVRFNSKNQIQNVRVHWDQASLLKQVEVIGNRARNWPVRDADKQTRLIKFAAASVPADNGPPPVALAKPASSAKEGQQQAPEAPPSPGKKYIKDPYAAESLYELLSPSSDRSQPVRPPRAPASGKPPPREYNELFVGDEESEVPDATPSRSRIQTKTGAGKNYRPSRIFDTDEVEGLKNATPVAPKAGAGRNFRPSRLFDDDETAANEKPGQIAYRANSKRFDHFELGADNSEREIKAPASRPTSRHNHWDFEDFATPEKPRRQARGEEIRHFGWSDDEPGQDTPPVKPRVLHPRRDAEMHFRLTDVDDEDQGARIIKSYQNKGLGLYKDTLYSEENDVDAQEDTKSIASIDRPLSLVHNGPNRQKDFQSHWQVTDEAGPADTNVNVENKKPVTSDRLKAVKMLEPSWDTYDVSPEPKKAPPPPQRRQLRNVNQRSWGVGED